MSTVFLYLIESLFEKVISLHGPFDHRTQLLDMTVLCYAHNCESRQFATTHFCSQCRCLRGHPFAPVEIWNCLCYIQHSDRPFARMGT